MSYKISRRTLLAGGGAFLTLPLLESFYGQKALAAGTSDPRRLIMVHMPDGTCQRSDTPNWYSIANGAKFTDSNANVPIPLQPFASNLGDITLLKYLTQSARDTFFRMPGGSDGHDGAKSCFFSGQVPTDFSASGSTMSGDSFDVMYAKTTPQKKIIYLAESAQVQVTIGHNYELSLNNGQNVGPETNPLTFYNNYFANLSGTSIVQAPASDYARNPKILDMPTAAVKDLMTKLGKNDNLKLQSFLQSLTDLKLSLGSIATTSICTKPPVPGPNQSNKDFLLANPNSYMPSGVDYFQKMFVFNSLIAIGFQCDLFRSISISLGPEAADFNFGGAYPSSLNYMGAATNNIGTHAISHHIASFADSGQNPALDNAINVNYTRDRLYMYIVVDLINKLKAVTDPSGSRILDNTAIMAGFCVEDGNHSGEPDTLGTPIIVAGGKNFMNPGRAIDAGAFDLNDLYYTFSTYFGMGIKSFYPIAQTSGGCHGSGHSGRTSGSSIIPL